MVRVSEQLTADIQAVTDATNTSASTLITPVYNVQGYGATGDGTTDDTQAFKDAIIAAGWGGRIFVPKPSAHYRITDTLHLQLFQTLEGDGFFLGAGPDSWTELRFSLPTVGQAGIVCDQNCTISNILIRKSGSVASQIGVSVSSGYGLRAYGMQLYSWDTGLSLTPSYYSTLYNCEWKSCTVGVVCTDVYNLTLFAPTFMSCNRAVNCTTSIRSLQIFGGSIEKFDANGAITLATGSGLLVAGTYWETDVSGGVGINGATSSTMTLIGNTVYLSNLARWVNTSSLTNLRVNATGNKFVYLTETPAVTPYAYYSTGTTNVSLNLQGDDWSQVTSTFASAYTHSTLANRPFDWHVVPPSQITTNQYGTVAYMPRSLALPSLAAAPTYPQTGAIYLADGSSWNPLSRGGTAPYLVFYNGTAYKGVSDA